MTTSDVKELSEVMKLDKIRRWLKQTDADLFMERVEEKTRRALSGLRTSDNMHEIGQNQGRLEVLAWIARLRQEEEED